MAGVAGEAISSKVELSISCSNLKDMDVFSKSDPVVFLYEHKGRERIKLGRTEVIDDNLNPKVRYKLYAMMTCGLEAVHCINSMSFPAKNNIDIKL